MTAQTVPPLIRVVGVTFAPGYPGNLLDLVERLANDELIPVELHRDLDNPEDLNATAVHVEGRRLGWLPRQIAAHVAPLIDAGHETTGVVWRVAVDLDHPDRPGLDVLLVGAR